MDIGILYICTGNYSVFWEDFYITCEKNFLPDLSKTYFVFSDERELKFLDSPNVVYSYQKKLGWPYDTLDRFSVFSKVSDQLKDFDYLFFFNANSLVVGEINQRDILDPEFPLIGAKQPVFYNKPNTKFPYERNPQSKAFVKMGDGVNYYMGSFNGGKSAEYLSMIHELILRIEEDKSKDIIAIWWDESHLNKYYLENHEKVKVLSPSYAYPEEMKLPFKKLNMLRDKKKMGGHHFLRGLTERKQTRLGITLSKALKSFFN